MSISFVKVFKEEQLLQNARHDVTERKKSIKLLLFPCHLILLVDTSIQTENNEIFKDFTGYFVAKPLFLDPWISFLRETPFFYFYKWYHCFFILYILRKVFTHYTFCFPLWNGVNNILLLVVKEIYDYSLSEEKSFSWVTMIYFSIWILYSTFIKYVSDLCWHITINIKVTVNVRSCESKPNYWTITEKVFKFSII